MQFFCSDCGSVLNLKDESDEVVPNKNIRDIDQVPPLPTGAALRFTDPIQIVPCKQCIDKYVGPARKLMEAIGDMKK